MEDAQAGVRAAGEDDAVHQRAGGEHRAHLGTGAGHELQGVAAHPGPPETLAEHPGGEHRVRGGFEHDRVAGGQGSDNAAAGNGDGEVPGRDDQGHAPAAHLEVGPAVVLAHRVRVELGEVDGLGDLHVRLGEHLAGVRGGRADQVAAAGAQFHGHPGEHLVALGGAQAAPAVRIPAGGLQGQARVLGRGQGVAADHHPRIGPVRVAAVGRGAVSKDLRTADDQRNLHGLVPRCLHPAVADGGGPAPVGCHGPVGVRLVDKAVAVQGGDLRGKGLGGAVLDAVGPVLGRGHGPAAGQEPFLQEAPLARADLQVRGVAEEVLRGGVLVQPADQVGDGVDELVLARHRRVQEHVARGLLQGPAHVVGHALEHLEVEQVSDAFGLGQHRGVGQFEQVVRGHAQVDRGDVVRLHAEGDHALVVGVHLELVVVGGERPVVEHRLEPLHLHVGALDDAQLDRRAAGRDPSPGPLGQLALDGEAVRQVGLEDDAGRVVAELLLLQGGDEGLVGDLQVAVLLHVQVDELGHPGAIRPDEEVLLRHPVDGREPLDQGGHGVLEVERADLREDGRDLDRDVLDVRILHVADVGGQPVGRLPLAEHRLAQVVDVHADALGLAPLQVGVQFLVLARDDGPAAAGAHLLDELGHGHGGEVLAHADEHLHDQFLHPAEKGRHTLLGHQAGQLIGHPLRVV